MQKSWRSDVDKLTFIACTAPVDALKTSTVESKKHDTPPTMIGDVNLFLTPDCSSDSESSGKDDEEGQHMEKTQALIGEIEIMIASPLHQGVGLGHSILLTFLWYMISYLRQITDEYSGGELNTYVKYLRVKIDKENVRSIGLFEKVGFEKVSEEANYFGELELRCSVSSTLATEIEGRMESRPVIAGYK
jgi:RimJ/RimL family protein N-acetyltransferase